MSKIMMSLRTKKKPKWWKSLYCSVHIECLFNWNCTKNVLCLICVRSFSWQGQRENFIYRYCASNRVDLSSFKIGSEKGGGGGGDRRTKLLLYEGPKDPMLAGWHKTHSRSLFILGGTCLLCRTDQPPIYYRAVNIGEDFCI